MSKIIPIQKNHWSRKPKTTAALLFLLGFCLIMIGFNEEKKLKVELPRDKWEKYVNGIENVKLLLRNSDLPSRTSNMFIDSLLTPMNNDFIVQLNSQLAKDTTKKK